MLYSKLSLASSLLLAGNALAIELDLSDAESIKTAARTIATSIVDRYNNGNTSGPRIPGLFSDDYYFWESGLAWDSLIHYWHQTGDDSYNDIIGPALRHQLGENNDFTPANQTKTLGNDDQASWAFAAMTAAEYGFPSDALEGLDTTWGNISAKVFDQQAARWDNDTCNGGLRWQIFAFNNGYNYKNSAANGYFYQLAARLARFTGNETYASYATRVKEWSFEVGLIASINATVPGAVFDGADSHQNCSDINHIQWSSNAGTYLAGSAYAYNHTPSAINQDYLTFLEAANYTFASETSSNNNGTIHEVACQPRNTCNTDQRAFKAILARALAQTRALTRDVQLTTYTEPVDIFDRQNLTANQGNRIPAWSPHQRIDFILQQSAQGAAAQCSGGENGTTCGADWSSDEWDGTQGLGEDLSALNVVLANIPITGRLATVNESAADAGESSGTVDDANSTITDVGDVIDAGADAAADAANDAADSGAAGHIAVPSVALMGAVGAMMAVL